MYVLNAFMRIPKSNNSENQTTNCFVYVQNEPQFLTYSTGMYINQMKSNKSRNAYILDYFLAMSHKSV